MIRKIGLAALAALGIGAAAVALHDGEAARVAVPAAQANDWDDDHDDWDHHRFRRDGDIDVESCDCNDCKCWGDGDERDCWCDSCSCDDFD